MINRKWKRSLQDVRVREDENGWGIFEHGHKYPFKHSPAMHSSGRMAKGDLQEDGGEGPERMRSLLRTGILNSSGLAEVESSSNVSSTRRLRED
ncbi:hypothetical protein ElyMa_000934500 [Elysia marginata]|uniref:Uncharacterized protein n=1 Tax=Elysia marginata TaxID=1093978 RepID=A0AAV4HE98_9GAST|nr:hypothetical protein ElyMa_000934500 [Elysia marginata]